MTTIEREQSQSPPNYEKGLQEQKAIKKLKKALGSLLVGFKYAGVHDGILKLTFVSRMHTVEFNSNKEKILKEMRQIYKDENLKEMITFKEVIAIYTTKPAFKKKQKELELPFKEHSSGNFKNVCTGKIGSLFEQIRNNIKEHSHDPKSD